MWDGFKEMCTEILMSFNLESELDRGSPQAKVNLGRELVSVIYISFISS